LALRCHLKKAYNEDCALNTKNRKNLNFKQNNRDVNVFKKILIYNSGGGIGDSIQLFPLILTLRKVFNDTEFFYLGAHESHFENKLKGYNVKINTLDLGLKYFGFRWWHLFNIKKKN
jgi:hypothetical protein